MTDENLFRNKLPNQEAAGQSTKTIGSHNTAKSVSESSGFTEFLYFYYR